MKRGGGKVAICFEYFSFHTVDFTKWRGGLPSLNEFLI